MQTLVQDITDLSMIESGEVTLNIEVHDLGQIVEEMLVLAGARAESAEIMIVNRVPRGFRICADRYRLEQILNNLVDNAIKFNRPGGRVEILAEKSDCGTSIIQVRDNGTGVSKADLSRVFERFFRADRSRSRDAGGSGLGLAIVKHLARAHGGSVRVESEQMKGSTFSVELPNCELCE
jgi:two-component system phosphate regulon sensor histidine kinase PhoR